MAAQLVLIEVQSFLIIKKHLLITKSILHAPVSVPEVDFFLMNYKLVYKFINKLVQVADFWR